MLCVYIFQILKFVFVLKIFFASNFYFLKVVALKPSLYVLYSLQFSVQETCKAFGAGEFFVFFSLFSVILI